MAVVCAGAKAILDLPRTLEVLETLGVPVVGFGTDRLPAFYSRESPWRVPHRVDRLEDLALQVATHLALEPATGMAIAQPPPRDLSLDFDRVEAWIAAAHATAADHGVSGGADALPSERALAPERSATNVALLRANARLGAMLAVALSGTRDG